MFKISDCSNKRMETEIFNDTRDAVDMIFTITENEEETKRAIKIMDTMHCGDIYSAKLFRITCIE